MKLYVKYKSNPMNTNWDISKQNNFNQKGTAMSPLTIVGRQKNINLCLW